MCFLVNWIGSLLTFIFFIVRVWTHSCLRIFCHGDMVVSFMMLGKRCKIHVFNNGRSAVCVDVFLFLSLFVCCGFMFHPCVVFVVFPGLSPNFSQILEVWRGFELNCGLPVDNLFILIKQSARTKYYVYLSTSLSCRIIYIHTAQSWSCMMYSNAAHEMITIFGLFVFLIVSFMLFHDWRIMEVDQIESSAIHLNGWIYRNNYKYSLVG